MYGFFTDKMINHVAILFDVPPKQVVKGTRRREVVRGRQALMNVMHRVKEMGYAEIGRRLGYDHTTVMHNVAVAEREALTDPQFAARLEELTARASVFVEGARREVSRRYVLNIKNLPARMFTEEVCALAGYSRATLRTRIAEGRMPAPIDKAGQLIFIRDDVLRALGLKEDTQPQEQLAAAAW
jgi:hypothetical protein